MGADQPPHGLLRLLPDSGQEIVFKFEPQEIVGALLLFALRIGYYEGEDIAASKTDKAEEAVE